MNRPTRRWPTPIRSLLAPLLAAAALGLAGCGTAVVNPVTGESERTVMDEAAEVEAGRQAHQQVLAEQGAYNHPRLQAYVNELGQRLARQSHRSQLTWTFTVLDSPEVNAFALPGGYVYVTRGILAYLDNEAELAGVIGHEIGHVTARHGAQRATRQQKAGIGVLAATVFGAVLETAGVRGATDLFSQTSQNMAAGYVASYSRDQESQADQLGAEYLVRNRYDPKNMVDVIGVLKSQERFAADQAKAEGRAAPAGANWLSSHPSNDQRLADIRRIAATYAAPASGYGDEGRARYLQALEGVTYGDGRAQGVTRGHSFYHEDLGITLSAPNGWRLQNRPDAIVLVNGAGDAGLVVRVVPPKSGSTHEEILRGLGQRLSGRPEPHTLNGLAATHFAGTVRNAQGQTQAVELTLVTGPGPRTYLLLPVSRDSAALQRAQTGLAQAEGSFRAMTAADRLAARPWAIRLQPLPRGGFAELARSSPLGQQAEGQLRLLNGVYSGVGPSNGSAAGPTPSAPEPKVGQLVKTIQP